MSGGKLTAKDKALIAAARDAIRQRYRNEWQEVGAALRTRDGRVITGVNIDAYLGRMAVCAEAVAIGRAITEAGDQGIETIVAVRHPKPDEKPTRPSRWSRPAARAVRSSTTTTPRHA